MRDLNEYFQKGLEIVRSCGIEPFRIHSVESSSRFHRRWGLMKMEDWSFRIIYSDKLLDEKLDDDFVLSVIVHEILHCVPGGMNHGETWQSYARAVMEKYPNLKIERSAPSVVDGVDLLSGCSKYVFRCKGCGQEYVRLRKSKLVAHPERFRCGACGGKLMRVNQE